LRLAQIHHFVAAVHTGSLRAAAQALGISQPAITKSIRLLEEELHVRLLQRNARGASPTPAGRAFLARARVVQAELRKAADDLEPYRGGPQGTVAMGIAPAACMLVVPDALLQFRRRYPAAGVRIVEGGNTALLPLVRDGTLDFSLGQGTSRKLDAGLRFKPLYRPRLVVVGRQGHPLRAATSLRELGRAQWLMFYPIGTGALEATFADAGLPLPAAIVHCESYAAALALLAKTDTLGLLLPQMLTEPYAQRYLQRIPVREQVPSPLVGMYSRADAPLTPAAAEMAQAVSAVARGLARP
jgi:DNA-binding transcriptional LysR family regulator